MKKIITIFFLYFQLFGYSQAVLKGSIKTSSKTPLAYANVIAKPKDSLKVLKFSITDDKGNYRIKLEKGEYKISISYLGYETSNFIFLAIKNSEKNVVLKEKDNRLDEIIIELPVTVKKDTIIYDIKKFASGDERKLKNILKKLPGVEVSKDGTVTVQGKKVTKMLVEGKEFFGGNSKLAVNNIPANAIDKIEVIDNYNEIAFLKNFSDSDEMAMNIKLKENKKTFVFGSVETGMGNKKFYRTHSNLFYYSSKTNLNFIGNINNAGEKTFTFEDYINFQGGINAVFKNGNSIYSNENDFSQFLNSKDLINSQNKFGALNISQEINNKLDISGYILFSNSKDENFNQSFNQYNTFNELKDDRKNTNNTLGIGKLTFDYMPNLKEQWYFKTQVKKTENNSINQINSSTNSINNFFLSTRKLNSIYLNQNVEWHKKASRRHTFSLATNFTFDKNNPKNIWESENPILQGIIPSIDEETIKLIQQKKTQNNRLDLILKHFWVINKNNHIYSTIGNTYTKQYFFSTDSQELINGSINKFNESDFGNDLIFRLNDLFYGIHYKFRTGAFTFKQGALFHSYNWKVNQTTKKRKTKTVILPDFLVKIEFSKSKKIELSYNLKTSFTDASSFSNQFYLQSYNSVFKGNETLENELYHSAKLSYRKFRMYRSFMIYANVSYNKKIKGIVNTINYQGINQYLSQILFNNPETNWNFNGNIRRKVRKINYNLGLNYNTSRYIQKTNSIIEENKNNNTSIKFSAKTLYNSFPTFEIGYKHTLGNYTSGINKSNFVTNEPFLNIDYNFLKSFIFSFNYKYYNYQNIGNKTKKIYKISNLILSYKKENSAWSYKITGNNLFNTKFKQNNSLSSYIISDSKTYILPRIIMFSIGYNL